MEFDFLNPNNWKDDHEYRIYADDYANEYALVSPEDYSYLVQWRWKPKVSRGGKKVYLCRSVTEVLGKDYYDDNGKRIQNRRVSSLFLHQAVMARKGDIKPEKSFIIDHANGNGMDCRRSNLRWVSISFNNRNRKGSHEWELKL